ncbi:MAG TPA: cytochrome C, partial [Trebonia sp.]|nr:cytochrome C [Trebonia sp.]
MDATPADGGTWSEVSGTTGDVVQARDVSGGIHFHRLASEVPRPRQLPSPQPVFVDREEAFAGLDGVVSAGAGRIAVVVGMPGVGKTALAVQWSNRNRDRFPDGQLYLNLHGYGEGPPVGPLRALWAFLVALGVPRSELAVDVEEAAAQYRSALAGRRVLIVLDNAREAQQARPLLPGHGACAVLVTSRAHMSGLVAREGARRIVLGVLPENDAVTLLARLVQSDRPDDQPSALGQFARLCARLPLALRIAAEHALSRPRTRLEDLVEDLRGQAALWRALTVEEGDQAEDLAAAQSVFAWSYRALPAEAARVFRLLAMHPGPDFGETAATALAG